MTFAPLVTAGSIDTPSSRAAFRLNATCVLLNRSIGRSAGFAPLRIRSTKVAGGQLRAIATTGAQRSKALSDVPTFLELGYPDLEFTAWFGFIAPAGVPDKIVDKLNGEIVRAVHATEVRAKLETVGFIVTGTSRAEFARIVEADT